MNSRCAACLAASLLLGCSSARVRTQTPQEKLAGLEADFADTVERFERGGVLVEEHFGGMVIDATSVYVRSESEKKLVAGVLEALLPGLAGPLGGPSVQTVDEYIDGMKQSEKEHPHPGMPPLDYDRIRAELMSDLQDHSAVVVRYISTKSAK